MPWPALMKKFGTVQGLIAPISQYFFSKKSRFGVLGEPDGTNGETGDNTGPSSTFPVIFLSETSQMGVLGGPEGGKKVCSVVWLGIGLKLRGADLV